MSINIRDIQSELRGRASRQSALAVGASSLAYMRGFQAGYEQAVKDNKRGKLRLEYSLQPHRAESLKRVKP